MTQSQMDQTAHLGFQISLLRLSTIPGPNSAGEHQEVRSEADKLEALVGTLVPGIAR